MVRFNDRMWIGHKVAAVGRVGSGTGSGGVHLKAVVECSCGEEFVFEDDGLAIEAWAMHAQDHSSHEGRRGYLPHSKLYTDRVYNVQRDSRRWVDRIPLLEVGPVFDPDAAREFYWVVTVGSSLGIPNPDEIPKILKSTDRWIDATPDDDNGRDELLDALDQFRDRLLAVWEKSRR